MLAVVLAAFCLLAWLLFNRWRQNQYRREALKELNLLEASTLTGSPLLEAVQVILKRTAIRVYGRTNVANLTGESWVSFLDTTLGSQEFRMGEGQILIDGHYVNADKSFDRQSLVDLARNWVRNHKRNLVAHA